MNAWLPTIRGPHASARQRRALRRVRAGFTLVELLVAITIIALLSAIALGGMYAARESARKAATQSLIAQLDEQIRIRWEALASRRLPLSPQVACTALGLNPANQQHLAAARLIIVRDLYRMEFPQRWLDVEFAPVVLPQRTAAAQAYFRVWANNPPSVMPVDLYQAAECLYLIVTTGVEDDGSGREHFSQRHIGDADNDGHPEFHDAWGNPIRFLRWPVQFPDSQSDVQVHDPAEHHDPFDPLRVDVDAYKVWPLIYSAGPDGIYDIAVAGTNAPFVTWNQYFDPGGAGDFYTVENWGAPIDSNNDSVTDPMPGPNGQLDHLDNIHNHRMDTQ